MAEGGGFLREPDVPGFSGLAGAAASGRGRKRKGYSTHELDELVVRARAPPGAGAASTGGASQQQESTANPPGTQAPGPVLDDYDMDDAAYMEMLAQLPSDTMAAVQLLRTQARTSEACRLPTLRTPGASHAYP